MALVVADRVKETTTSVGTSTINLAGAEDNFESFVTGVGSGNTTYYAIVDKGNSEFEVGLGTVTSGTPDTLSRDTVLASSNSDALVNFASGSKDVFCTQPAEKAVYLDSSGQLVIDGTAVTATAAELNYVDGVTSNIQTQLDSKLNLSGGTMTGALTLSGAPTADNHATTKIYVDELIAAGIHYHDPVRVESPDSAGSLTATYNNGASGVGATLTNNGTQAALVIDGVTLNTNDRVLIYNQTNAFENGIYTVTNTGSASTNWVLTRATDADSYGVDNQSLSEGTSIFVLEGTDGSGEVYACTTTGTITFGTTAINFSQIGKSAVITGNGGITVTGNQVSANVDATVQTTAANSVTSTASRTYGLQVDSGNDLVVNVPWTDTTTNQTITLSGDASGSGTTSISVSLATDSVGSDEIAANAVSASELNVTGDGTTSQFLRSDGDGSFTWATPTDTTANETITLSGDATGSGTTSITVSLATDSVGANEIAANSVSASELNVTGNGTTTQFLRSDGDGSFTWATPPDNDTTYSVATASTLGLVKIGYTENAKNYPVELSSGQMFVNVPWTDTTGNQTITLSGDVSGSGTTSITTTVANDSHTHDTRYYSETESDGRYYTEGGTSYTGTYPLLARIGARNAYSNSGITFTGSTNTLSVTGNITVGGTVDGRDVATDGTKLDGIEAGATADQTASEILTAIKTVDGSGSGLDADTLDGAQPSVSAGNSTIVQRHASGYIFANYFNTTANDVSSGVTKVMVETGNDNYIRHGDAASIRTFINVENGATADQTASEILTSIKTVDGSGSGLDADLLDGQHASAFQAAANELTWVDQATGNYGTIKVDDDRGVTWAGYAIRDDWVFMSDGTNAGIYNDTDNKFAIYLERNAEAILYYNGVEQLKTLSGGVDVSGDLYVDDQIIHNGDTNTYMQFHAADQWRVVTGGTERLEVNNSGITASVDITVNSDERIKDNIEQIPDALEKVQAIRGVTFNRTDTDDDTRHAGVIAQEVEKVLPEVVTENAETGIKSVAYANMVSLLIEAIKEQQTQIDDLKNEVIRLKGFE